MTLCAACPIRGDCCRYVELPIQFWRQLTDDECKWINLHPGFHATPTMVAAPWQPEPTVAHPGTQRWDVACSALAADGSCKLYGQPERPEMCSRWPDGPNQAPTGCLYNDALVQERGKKPSLAHSP